MPLGQQPWHQAPRYSRAEFHAVKGRLTMRHILLMLRLSAGGTSVREIAAMLGIARSTVQDCILS
ncbi:helix-turn-helix domain-containing protein [Pararhizobium sp. LjRoot235]|uniref:helix-turn-helix domain-containing protein n=1 Tax=Pararhizobium sp. LjRoot235 TaxID=3342291 RepID=UPI003F4FC415